MFKQFVVELDVNEQVQDEFFFALNGIDRTNPGQFIKAQMVAGENGFKHFQFSYLRAAGIDASYTPYVSVDLLSWSVAPMLIKSLAPEPGTPGLERVTLETTYPASDAGIFFRIQPNFNRESIEAGLIPEKPLQYSGSFANLYDPVDPARFSREIFDQTSAVITYGLAPGKVLFFNIASANEDSGTVYGTDIYQDWSRLQTAVVHAGVLGNGDSGVVKVTFGPPPASYTASPRNGVDSQLPTVMDGPNSLSYMIEFVTSQTGAN